jgi:hypothetical protein
MSSRVYDRAVPDGATLDSKDLDTAIQQKGQDLDEAMVQGGHKMPTLTHSAAAQEGNGKHCVGIEDQANHNDAGDFSIWSFDGLTALLQVHGKDHATKPGQIEPLTHAGVPFKFVGPGIVTGDNPGHRHTDNMMLGDMTTTTLSVASYIPGFQLRYYKAAGAPVQSIVAFMFSVQTTYSGGPTTIQLRKVPAGSAAATISPFSDGVASVVVATVTLNASEYRGITTTIAGGDLVDGDILVVKMATGAINAGWLSAQIAMTK